MAPIETRVKRRVGDRIRAAAGFGDGGLDGGRYGDGRLGGDRYGDGSFWPRGLYRARVLVHSLQAESSRASKHLKSSN